VRGTSVFNGADANADKQLEAYTMPLPVTTEVRLAILWLLVLNEVDDFEVRFLVLVRVKCTVTRLVTVKVILRVTSVVLGEVTARERLVFVVLYTAPSCPLISSSNTTFVREDTGTAASDIFACRK
jgi:hypothetical protein